jgi:hypothetical protein
MWTTVFVFVGTFFLLMVLSRGVHRAMHTVALLLTNNYQTAALLYALPLLPGVALHEVSHALMAILLRVRVRRFTLVPKRAKGAITLGSVEITRTDHVRMSLIGLAPMMMGMSALTIIGWNVFSLGKLTEIIATGDFRQISNQMYYATQVGDAFFWFYLMFSIANAMMPSASDTVSLPPVLLFLTALAGAVIVTLGIDWLRFVGPSAITTMRWLSAVFVLTAFINVLVLIPLWFVVQALQKITGRQVIN